MLTTAILLLSYSVCGSPDLKSQVLSQLAGLEFKGRNLWAATDATVTFADGKVDISGSSYDVKDCLKNRVGHVTCSADKGSFRHNI